MIQARAIHFVYRSGEKVLQKKESQHQREADTSAHQD